MGDSNEFIKVYLILFTLSLLKIYCGDVFLYGTFHTFNKQTFKAVIYREIHFHA